MAQQNESNERQCSRKISNSHFDWNRGYEVVNKNAVVVAYNADDCHKLSDLVKEVRVILQKHGLWNTFMYREKLAHMEYGFRDMITLMYISGRRL